jgi:hypothetical protein
LWRHPQGIGVAPGTAVTGRRRAFWGQASGGAVLIATGILTAPQEHAESALCVRALRRSGHHFDSSESELMRL